MGHKDHRDQAQELLKLDRKIRAKEKELEMLNRKRNRLLKTMKFYGADID
jgi:seryl-tRNA synthetase